MKEGRTVKEGRKKEEGWTAKGGRMVKEGRKEGRREDGEGRKE